MPIYTKTGDSGTTSLFGGKRVSKADLQIETYGALDELNSFLGLAEAKLIDQKDKKLITVIQNDLYTIMAHLAGYPTLDTHNLTTHILLFEKTIDTLESKLPKLTSFILPQGGETSALFHVARTICRRAEREVVGLFFQKKWSMVNGQWSILMYLNRLSDLLFMLARKYSLQETKAKHSRL